MLSSSSLTYRPGGGSHPRPTRWPVVSPVADPDLCMLYHGHHLGNQNSRAKIYILMSLKRAPSDYLYSPLCQWLAASCTLTQGEMGYQLELCCVRNRWCGTGAPAKDSIIGEHEENNHVAVIAFDICFRKRIRDSLHLKGNQLFQAISTILLMWNVHF